MTERSAWMIRAGNDNELIAEYLDDSKVTIGWTEIEDLSSQSTREDVKSAYKSTYPKHSKYRRGVNAGQLHRFVNVIDEGDLIFTYDKSARVYHAGTVTGEYQYSPSDGDSDYPHVRPVQWEEEISRDSFSKPVKNTLGSSLTVFSLDDCLDEIERVLSGDEEPSEEEDEETPPYIQEVEARAEELISDQIAKMDPFDFEELVAGVLEAMGYHAETTEAGPDRGIDIVAHPDTLGFESPVIKAQVKHRSSSTGGPEMREFSGSIGDEENGLYVSTGGYTRDAKRAARTASQRISLFDRDEFIDLLIEHYEELEPEYKTYVPLKSVYIPTDDSGGA